MSGVPRYECWLRGIIRAGANHLSPSDRMAWEEILREQLRELAKEVDRAYDRGYKAGRKAERRTA